LETFLLKSGITVEKRNKPFNRFAVAAAFHLRLDLCKYLSESLSPYQVFSFRFLWKSTVDFLLLCRSFHILMTRKTNLEAGQGLSNDTGSFIKYIKGRGKLFSIKNSINTRK